MRKITVVAFISFITLLNITSFLALGNFTRIAFGIFLIYFIFVGEWQLLHCAIFFLLASLADLFPFLRLLKFPIAKLLILLLISSILIPPFRQTRAALSWFKLGRIDFVAAVLLIITAVISSGSLIIWAFWTDNLGIAVQMFDAVSHYPKIIILFLIIPLFALTNALVEEAIYRGILHEALTHIFSNGYIAVGLQATAFAAIHFAGGFPNGVIGYLMVLFYGIMLGYLKKRTGGMLSPYLAHVVADLTIGYYIVHVTASNVVFR